MTLPTQLAAQGVVDETDWKQIATELGRRLAFIASFVRDAGGSGIVLNMEDGTSQHWRDYAADGLEMIPGVKVDREMLHAQVLPRSKRAKAIREIEQRRAKATP